MAITEYEIGGGEHKQGGEVRLYRAIHPFTGGPEEEEAGCVAFNKDYIYRRCSLLLSWMDR